MENVCEFFVCFRWSNTPVACAHVHMCTRKTWSSTWKRSMQWMGGAWNDAVEHAGRKCLRAILLVTKTDTSHGQSMYAVVVVKHTATVATWFDIWKAINYVMPKKWKNNVWFKLTVIWFITSNSDLTMTKKANVCMACSALGTLMTTAAADVINGNGRKIGRFKPRRFR